MMNDAKESYMGHLSCKNHTARTEKNFYRICPSKLSKRELEDLYFALLEENVQLKKTTNEQREQIKVLNTKVQRMTVQKPVGGFHNRDCCAGNKAIINEQKESIADLKKANERLSERLRILNMRLCSAKQFLRRGSSQAISHCTKCLVSSASIKNSTSALNTKRSDTKLRIDSPSCQTEKDNIPLPLAEIDIPTQMAEVTSSQAEVHRPSYGTGQECQRSECRTEIDELRLKIIALEEEVCLVRRSHSERMRVLEVEHSQCEPRAARLAEELRGTRQRTEELSTQLRVLRARESELSVRRRDDRVTGDIDRAAASLTNRSLPLCDAIVIPPEPALAALEDRASIIVPNNSGIAIFVEEKCHKDSDDSGCTDYIKKGLGDEKEQAPEDQIETQIANLQTQLDNLKVNTEDLHLVHPNTSLGADSSLSHDIFSTSRIKTLAAFEKIPSTSCEPDVLLSTDHVIDELAPEKTQKFGRDFKYNIPTPLSLDMPKISLGDTGTDIKIVEDETINKKFEGRSSKASVKINLDNVDRMKQELLDDKHAIIDSIDKSNQLLKEMIEEEKTNNDFKKSRRSSLKPPNERKQSRDAAVRYAQNQKYKNTAETESNAKKVSQGADVEKVYVEPDEDHESDPSVQYKVNERMSIRRIRYMTDVQTDPYMESEKKPGLDNGTRRAGTDRLDNEVGVQCLRDPAHRDSCDAERAVPHVSDGEDVKETTANVANVGTDSPVLCAGMSRVCECPSVSVPAPATLRTCSGGTAAPPLAPLRYRSCNCQLYPTPISPAPPTPRPASSERTDCELSSLTDPTLTHDTIPLDYISPGEERATSTLSDSYNTTECGSLSEGEVPPAGDKRLTLTKDKMTEPVRGSRSGKMEEALRAISEELTRCRELLQGRGGELTESVHPAGSKYDSHLKPEVHESTRSSLEPTGGDARSLVLRRAGGSFRMRDAYAPKCIFTLHVGTLVLADQAAALSRGRSLVARWCFYRQPPGDTRALEGRVINYDCTAHYDNDLTEHFLYYLKHEEMPIIISEVDKQDEEYATCMLPLRDALLHPNRRVDMSLALVPGGGSGDEAGVLDVWCSLRVDASALSAINTAIVRPSSLKNQHHASSMLDQIVDDDQSVDYRFSRDMHRQRSKGASEDNQSYRKESQDRVPELSRSYNEVIEDEVPANIRSVNDFRQAVAKKSNDSTSIYEMLKNKKWSRRSTLGSQKAQEGRQKSVTIRNHPSCSINRRDISRTTSDISAEENFQSLDITILWLALNEDCAAMSDPSVKRLYVAYNFLGRGGADLETPISLPKPKHYMEKCHFLFKRTFPVSECDMPTLARLARSVPAAGAPDPTRAVVFSVVSEPDDDPLGLNSCEDIGYAYLYLGEVLSRCTGPSYTAVLEVRGTRDGGGGAGAVCGALAVRLDGLALLRRCQERAGSQASAPSLCSLI